MMDKFHKIDSSEKVVCGFREAIVAVTEDNDKVTCPDCRSILNLNHYSTVVGEANDLISQLQGR